MGNCAFGRALNSSSIVRISCGHYSQHALCVFIYLSDSHLAAITNASNCNQQPLGAFNASRAVAGVSPWVNARQLLRSFCVYYPWIDACSCYKSNKTYYKCLSQPPPPLRLSSSASIESYSICSLVSTSWRYYSDLSASRCASNLTNFAQIMRRPQMMTMTTTRTMAIPVPVSVLPCAQQKATKLLLH